MWRDRMIAEMSSASAWPGDTKCAANEGGAAGDLVEGSVRSAPHATAAKAARARGREPARIGTPELHVEGLGLRRRSRCPGAQKLCRQAEFRSSPATPSMFARP